MLGAFDDWMTCDDLMTGWDDSACSWVPFVGLMGAGWVAMTVVRGGRQGG